MPRCIYCSKDKDPSEFNREHVLNQAFGRFETNLVLRCVCKTCNQELGDTIDLVLGRDSMEGYDRIAAGVKDATEFKSMGRKGMTRIEFAKDGHAPWRSRLRDPVKDRRRHRQHRDPLHRLLAHGGRRPQMVSLGRNPAEG